jgi:chemotaxis response regulator CheB
LILSEELEFLLGCYSTLHQDARVGQVEAATGRDEAAMLLRTFRPDVLVLDWSAGSSAGFGAVLSECNIPPGTRIVVSCDQRDGAAVAPHARAIGAIGLLRRETVSAESVIRAYHGPGARKAPAPAH